MRTILTNILLFIFYGIFVLCTQVYAQVDLQNGLVAYYPFNGNANDESGNGNNGSVIGANLVTDRFGNTNSAYYFDGVSSYIRVKANSTLDLTTSAGFSFWLKWTDVIKSNTEYGSKIISKGLSGQADGYVIDILNGSHPFYGTRLGELRFVGGSAGFEYITDQNEVKSAEWQHIFVNYTGSLVEIYSNGQLINQYATSFTKIDTSSVDLTIGSDYVNQFNYTGIIDDISIYNRALNSTEIQALYTQGCDSYFANVPTISLTGNILAVTSLAGADYQWYYNNTSVIGATNAVYTGTMDAGNYKVSISKGTCSITTNVYTIVGSVNLENGLVAYYPFNGNANDESGNDMNGITNNVTLTDDRFGNINKAYSFSGDNSSYIRIINDPRLNFTSSFSISYWANFSPTSPNDPNGLMQHISKGRDVVNSYNFRSDDNLEYFNLKDQFNNISISNPVSQTVVWKHYVGIVDLANGTMSFYVNNIKIGENSVNEVAIDNSFDLYFGIHEPTTLYYYPFKGKLDDIRIYNRVLNQTEISSLYSEGCDSYFANAPVITLTGNTLSVTSVSGASYQWYYNNTSVTGATDLVYNGTVNAGNYTAILTNGACSVTTNVYTVTSPVANISNGLVAYYPFNGNANDESGNGNNGTVTGAVLSTNRFYSTNSSYLFSGANNNLINAGTNLEIGHSSFTLSTWFKTTKGAVGSHYGQRIISKGATDRNKGFVLGINYNTTGVINFAAGSSDSPDPSSSFFIYTNNNQPYNDDKWHNAVAIVDNDTKRVRLYVDGALQNIAKVTSLIYGGNITGNELDISGLNIDGSSSDSLCFGKLPGNANENFAGNIDEIRIYNRVLNQAEISTLYLEGCDSYFINTPVITLTGNSLSVTSIPGASYQWYYNNTSVTGATDAVYNGTVNAGNYSAILTNGACSVTTNVYTVTSSINLENGLVAYYPFNGNANDESGNGNNGTVSGALLSSDRFDSENKAYTFNGNSDFINLGNNEILKFKNGDKFTVSAWIKFEDIKFPQIPISHGGGGYAFYAQYDTFNNFYYLEWSSPNNKNTNIKSGIMMPDTWYHILSINTVGESVQTYLNGNLVFNTSFLPTYTYSYDLNLGKSTGEKDGNNNDVEYFYKGVLDEVRVYNRAVNESEIQSLYTEGCDSYFANTSIITLTGNTLAVTPVAGAAYQWYYNNISVAGATNAVYNGTINAGNYSAILTNGACSIASNTYVVTCNVLPLISISGPGTVLQCQAVSYSVESIAGVSYSWVASGEAITGINTANAVVNWKTPGIYFVEIVIVDACRLSTSTSAINVTVTNLDFPVPVIERTAVNLRIGNTTTGINYQWQFNNTDESGQVSSIHTIQLQNGIYQVWASPDLECSSKLSDPIEISLIHELVTVTVVDVITISGCDVTSTVDKVNSQSFNIHPNPSTGFVYLESAIDIGKIEVYNGIGKLVHSSDYHDFIDLSNHPKGIYVLKIHNGKQDYIHTYRVIIE